MTKVWSKVGFPANSTHTTNSRTERNYARNANYAMTSLLDRPITAASDDVVCCWHAAIAKLWQTPAKLLKLNLIWITSCTTSKNVLKFALLIFF